MTKTLDELLALARNHVMTKEEKDAQRKSWVVGEMMLSHLQMSREEAGRIYDEIIGS